MKYDQQQPLLVQNDFTILMETDHQLYDEVRTLLVQFADVIKSPGILHTYRMTPLSLWNAASTGISSSEIIDCLRRYSKNDLPKQIQNSISEYVSRYGRYHLEWAEGRLYLCSSNEAHMDELIQLTSVQEFMRDRVSPTSIEVSPLHRGIIKQELIKIGYPVQDYAGYHQGESLSIQWKGSADSENPFQLRGYQAEALKSFYQEGSFAGGNGVIVLPCGAGKTIVGIAAMVSLNCATLILAPNVTSVRQWKREIIKLTLLGEEDIGEYSGDCKMVRPVTVATYQILTHRTNKNGEFHHLKLFNERDWGLIIYDEVHLLPAPVFRATANIQAKRRLGLTATLIREDGRQEDVFALVGPKRFDKPWKALESEGWISKVHCTEYRVPLPMETHKLYEAAGFKRQFRIAGENPLKFDAVDCLLERHRGEFILVIGLYVKQLKQIAAEINAPFLYGDMPHSERDILYQRFNDGNINVLVVSKVANFAVDLPDASVAIQISGSYGSRQEEAQRLGRILRPKADRKHAYFYTIISSNTQEQDFALKRQLFLVEQGYQYNIEYHKKMPYAKLASL